MYAYVLIPETKGLSLEQVDRMLEETTPRTSAKWVPHETFAAAMGVTDKGTLKEEVLAHVHHEKAVVEEPAPVAHTNKADETSAV